jgi:hypothetical protein
MNSVQQRMQTHPESAATDIRLLSECIEALFDCAQSCTFCADACLAEEDVGPLLDCIRLNQDCADVCIMAGKLLSRQRHPDWQLLRGAVELAARACGSCGGECDLHSQHHDHCKLCAEACNAAQGACNALLVQLRS